MSSGCWWDKFETTLSSQIGIDSLANFDNLVDGKNIKIRTKLVEIKIDQNFWLLIPNDGNKIRVRINIRIRVGDEQQCFW